MVTATALTAQPSRTGAFRKTALGRVATSLLFLSLTAAALPETATGRLYIGELPLEFAIFLAGALFCAISLITSKTGRISPWLPIGIAAGAYMTFLGLASGNSPHFLIVDGSQFTGLLIGLAWARQRPLPELGISLGRLGTLLAVLLLFNIFGLMTGVIAPSNTESERIYTNGLFESTRLLSLLLPLLFLLVRTESTGRRTRAAQLRAHAASAAVAIAAVISSTRSILITWLASMLLVAWLSLARKTLAHWVALIVVGFVILQSAAVMLDHSDIRLVQRLRGTRLQDEQRYEEVEMMFDFLENRNLVGTGFGSRFESCVVADGDTLAHAPHVAVLTLWLKGGCVIFLAFVVLPLLRAIRAVASFPGRGPGEPWRSQAGLAACIVLYVVSASMSGGWSFSALFLYGAALAATGPPYRLGKPRRRAGRASRLIPRTKPPRRLSGPPLGRWRTFAGELNRRALRDAQSPIQKKEI